MFALSRDWLMASVKEEAVLWLMAAKMSDAKMLVSPELKQEKDTMQ